MKEIGVPQDSDLKEIQDYLYLDSEKKGEFWTVYLLCIWWIARRPTGITTRTLEEYLEWGDRQGQIFSAKDENGKMRVC